MFVGDGVQFLRPELRNQMNPDNRILRRDSARLLPIRPRVPVEEPRRELFKCRHLLFGFGPTVLEQMPLTVLAPSLRSGLRRHGCFAPVPVHRAVRQAEGDVHLPPAPSIRSYSHHRPTPSAMARTFGGATLVLCP